VLNAKIGGSVAGVSSLNALTGIVTITGIGGTTVTLNGQAIQVSGGATVDLSPYATIVYVTGVSGSLQSQVTTLNNATGNYVLTGQTGQFYSASNPSGFITSVDLTPYATTVNLASTGSTLQSQVNTLNAATGELYPKSNPSGFITTGQTGQFYSNNNPSGYATTSYVDNVSGVLNDKISGSSAGVSSVNTQTGALTFTGAGNVTVSINGQTFTISGSGGGGGEANTASNLGEGSGLFAQKSSVDLQFKSLKVGSDLSLTGSSTELAINLTGTFIRPSDTGIFATNAAINSSGFQTIVGYNTAINSSGFATNSAINSSGFQTVVGYNTAINASGFQTTAAYNAAIGASGFATDASINASGFATAANLAATGSNLQGQITTLNNATGTYAQTGRFVGFNKITVSTSAPANPATGDIWIDIS
jgi:hypothetical protein